MNDTPGGVASAGGPPAYLLVQGKITDLEGFKAYSAALPPIYRKYGGEYLALVPAALVEVAEGASEDRSVVLARFPSRAAARAVLGRQQDGVAERITIGVRGPDLDIVVPGVTRERRVDVEVAEEGAAQRRLLGAGLARRGVGGRTGALDVHGFIGTHVRARPCCRALDAGAAIERVQRARLGALTLPDQQAFVRAWPPRP